MMLTLKKIKFVPKWVRYKLWYRRYKSKFKLLGEKSFINSPLTINGFKNIEIGDNVYVGYKSWLAAVPNTAGSECLLKFGEGCSIGNFNHIYATKSIVFGKKVLTADKVYVSDNLHTYENVEVSILEQPIKQINEVYIGDGSWIGENVCIMGARVGKHCVIGANAVVTKDIPDYSIVVGNPSKIIKRYDFNEGKWLKTKPDGSFQ